ncbi:hypothetical protein [Nonomuraea sp. NPDC049158]|uniref:hypothetical protein n=1 Tax=Nonomuraea sp. NPDC049158 TaxID=3155649 RepID=UPI0033C97183
MRTGRLGIVRSGYVGWHDSQIANSLKRHEPLHSPLREKLRYTDGMDRLPRPGAPRLPSLERSRPWLTSCASRSSVTACNGDDGVAVWLERVI